MPKKFDNILFQDKYHMIIKNNTLKHSQVLMRPKVRAIIHDKLQNKLLLLQENWEASDYGYFLPEDNLYSDVQNSFDKTNEELLQDALKMAKKICANNGIAPKKLEFFLEDFRSRINCSYYYFLVTDFEQINAEMHHKGNWISISEILELIKNNAFYDEDVVGLLFTYFLKQNKVIYK